MKNVIIHGDCLEALRKMDDNSVDSVVTDPPYGLSKEPNITEVLTKWLAGEQYDHGHGGFMGKAWDSFVPHPDVWKEIYRVLKPGGHALVFAGTRTQDLMTVSLRLGGFEIRDVIEWLYFSGFPKSMDVGKQMDKRVGAEREVLYTRKKLQSYGHSGNNTYGGDKDRGGIQAITAPATDLAKQWDGWGTALKPAHEPIIVARKPLVGTVAETVEKYGTGAINIDACRIPTEEDLTRLCIGLASADNAGWKRPFHENAEKKVYGSINGRFPANCVTTEADAFYSQYFNVGERMSAIGNVTPREVSKKASKADRGEGNTHPTVKPTALMAWLVRLVTPPGGTALDPFAGSGTTLVSGIREGFNVIGIEQTREYCDIAAARSGLEIIEIPEVGETSSRQTSDDITKEVAYA